jgi:Planctomycete cytochrome C
MRAIGVLLIVLVFAWLTAPCAEPEPPPKPAEIDFRRDVAPILEAKCNRCHGARQRGGKLDLRTREAMLKGGNTGAAIEPGNPDKSLLVELIHFNEMPPKKSGPRVTAEELKLLKDWIKAGALVQKE